MLRWFPAARFAYNAPLLAERRLLHVSSQSGSGEPGSPERKKLVPFGMSDEEFTRDHIESVRKQTEESTKNLVATEADPDITETLQSDETAEIIEDSTFFNELFDDTQLLEDERFTNLSAEDRESVLRTVLNGESGMKAALLLAQLYQRRAERYEELLQLIENKLSVTFGRDSAQTFEKIFGSSWREKVDRATVEQLELLQTALAKLPSKTLAHLLTIRKDHEMESTDRSAIAGALNLAGELKEHEDDVSKRLTSEEQSAVTSFIVDLESTVHKKRKLGLKEGMLEDDTKNHEDKDWQQPYLEGLHGKKNTARKLLLIKLRKEAHQLLAQNNARRKELVQELHLDPSMSEDEASRRSIARFGIGYDALVQTCFDADIPALEILGDLENGNLPPFDDEKTFLRAAKIQFDKLREVRTADSVERLLAEERTKQEDAQAWLDSVKDDIQQVLQLDAEERSKVREVIGEDLWEKLEDLNADDLFLATDFSEERRQAISTILVSLLHGRDDIEESVERGDLELPEREGLTNSDIIQRCVLTRTFLKQLLGELLPEEGGTLLKNSLTEQLSALDAVRTASTHIAATLDRAEKEASEDLLRDANLRIRQLEQCKNLLGEIFGNIVETDDPTLLSDKPESGTFTTNARFNPKKRMIVVRSTLAPDEKESALEHEKAHAILYALRKSGVAPLLLAPMEGQLGEATADGRTLREILEIFAERWGIQRNYPDVVTQLGRNRADQWKEDELLEELMLKYAEWLTAGKPQDEDTDLLTLFSALEEAPRRDLSHDEIAEILGMDRLQTTGNGGEAKPPVETPNFKQNLVDVVRNIAILENFLAAYKTSPNIENQLAPLIKEYKARNKQLEEGFLGRRPDLYGNIPEQSRSFRDQLKELKDKSDNIVDRIRTFDVKKLDITKERKTKKPKFLTGMAFMSILDFQKLIKDTIEDIKTMYGRNQERKLHEVGDSLFSALDKGKNIPIFGSYFEKMKGYHTRRYSGAEIESVNKWKEGLENEDSHAILHMIPYTKNKDQIRAILTLLTDRGEMDWNDRDTMKKLGELSGYDVPIEACLRDDVLRDTWYRKMVTEIWKDKELYYQWRGSNDDKTDSGKKHFTTFVDQLSNVRGGMASELAKQLHLQIEWKELHAQGIHASLPEDIKPHLYEEVIHYAIRNGKMTMEQKFYYLVRGVAEGILSIDRLRALAGEHGGVLNQFPFIDYFYQRNNSLPEVRELAKRLTERDEHNRDTFEPGTRTTLWLHLEVSREEKVQERLSKGTSRTGAEEIDHEDIPFFITQLDYNNGVRNLADVISGSRQKVTPEGWKNAYVGFSSKLKIFGRLAEMDAENFEKFTVADARNLSQTIAAYIDMDNILTRNGIDNERRPTLSEYQFDGMPVSGDGDHTARQYREKINEFIGALMQTYGNEIEQSDEWVSFNNELRSREPRERAGTAPPETVSLAEYAPSDGRFTRNRGKKKQTLVFEGTPHFVKALEKAIMNDLSGFKALLRSNLTSELFDEGGSKGKLQLEDVKKVFRERHVSPTRDIPSSGLPGGGGVAHGGGLH